MEVHEILVAWYGVVEVTSAETRSRVVERSIRRLRGYPRHMPTPSAADLHRALTGVDFPCGRSELLAAAKTNDADRHVLAALDALPNKRYLGSGDVQTAMGVF